MTIVGFNQLCSYFQQLIVGERLCQKARAVVISRQPISSVSGLERERYPLSRQRGCNRRLDRVRWCAISRPGGGIQMNVMIVEDESLIAMELERIAQSTGHRTIGPLSTVEQALAYAPKADIALVDIGLSDGQSGTQLARRLIDRYGMEVIFVTGNPESVRGWSDGVAAVVAKPFTDEILSAAIESAAQHRNRFPHGRRH
jgi:CheY-like chemotaxis protein